MTTFWHGLARGTEEIRELKLDLPTRRRWSASGAWESVAIALIETTVEMRRYGGLNTRGIVGTRAQGDPMPAARYEHVVITAENRMAILLPGNSRELASKKRKR